MGDLICKLVKFLKELVAPEDEKSSWVRKVIGRIIDFICARVPCEECPREKDSWLKWALKIWKYLTDKSD